MSIETPFVSIVMTCKGRLHHLRETLPTALAQAGDFDYEVIVVDYGCPQGTFEWLRSLDLRRLVAVRVTDGVERFNVARARNCGARLVRGRVLAFVDADIRLAAGWLANAAGPILQGHAGLCNIASAARGWDRCGTCAVAAWVYHLVRGYDECFCGWGPEDNDFYQRCLAHTTQARYSPALASPIRHRNEERVAFYAEKSIVRSNQQNGDYLREREGAVNPEGYGVGKLEVFRGTQEAAWAAAWTSEKRLRTVVRRPMAVGSGAER